jgi:c-di-GMP-binding flagellar brake protein YcgR
MEEAEKAISLAAHELERRGMPRCAVDEEATLVVLGQGRAIPGRMVDLSAGGCRLVLLEKLPPGMHAPVEVSFKVRGFVFRLSGLTEWTSGGVTVGLSFGPMSARRRDDLLEALCEVEAANVAKIQAAIGRGGAADAATGKTAAGDERGAVHPFIRQLEPMHAPAQAENFHLLEKVFRTAAEAGSGGNAGAAAGAGSRDLKREPVAGDGLRARDGRGPRLAARRERRTESRCAVDTSAVIHLVKIASRLAGQILDLSLGGCRIRTAERFPVGIYTRVEIEFRLQGTALLLGGVVQAIHGRNDVGVRFLDVSPRKREQLVEMVQEVRQAGMGEV